MLLSSFGGWWRRVWLLLFLHLVFEFSAYFSYDMGPRSACSAGLLAGSMCGFSTQANQ